MPDKNDKPKYNLAAARSFISRWLASRQGQLSQNMGGAGVPEVKREYARQIGRMYDTPVYDNIPDMMYGYTKDRIMGLQDGSDEKNRRIRHINGIRAVIEDDNKMGGIRVSDPSTQSQMIYMTGRTVDGRGPQSGLVHELSHSLGKPGYTYSLSKPQEKAIHDIMRGRMSGAMRNPLLRPYDETYPENPTEIYSRLMEFRYNNNLDPSKRYTLDEIKELRNNSKDAGLFDRYTDEVMLELLNNIASATDLKPNNGYERA